MLYLYCGQKLNPFCRNYRVRIYSVHHFRSYGTAAHPVSHLMRRSQMSRLPPWQVRNNGERFRETVVAHHLWYNRCTEERQVESPGKHIVTCFCKIYAGVAQR